MQNVFALILRILDYDESPSDAFGLPTRNQFNQHIS